MQWRRLQWREPHPEGEGWIEVEALFFPACRGARDAWGAPLEPDEPPQITIESVYDSEGRPLDPSGWEPLLLESALQHCI